MHLYNLTLHKPTAITAAVAGNFSAPGAHEFCVARGNTLELLRGPSAAADPDAGSAMVSVHAQRVFGNIRGLSTIRLWAEDRDHLVLSCDAGKTTVLRFDASAGGRGGASSGAFVNVTQAVFGKTGCRRVVPGQWLCCEQSANGGRVLMIGASEKQKLGYKIGRDADSGAVTLSSPLLVDRARVITFDCASVEVGTENPEFACLEVDYGDLDDNDNDGRSVAAHSASKMLSARDSSQQPLVCPLAAPQPLL